MSLEVARETIRHWTDDRLRNIRFSGGEPTMWPHLEECVRVCRERGVERIAISTNGSAALSKYRRLVDVGVNDFSISLDACCSAMGATMAGRDGVYGRVLRTIEELSKVTYVTLGVVLTPCNKGEIGGILRLARELGVADVRVIPSAQSSRTLADVPLEDLGEWPILRYRAQNLREGKPVRGLCDTDCSRCRLVLDDSVVAGKWHFPCVIYLREGGNPIGEVGPGMRAARATWSRKVNVLEQPICRANCLDVCRDYNSRCKAE
jgi:MoaA/NifB/PqqE/SkfB family radical SAM enzyme